MTQSFDLLADPRVSTPADAFAEQFDLLIRIQSKLSEIATGVNTIRSLTKQIDSLNGRLADVDGGADIIVTATALADKMRRIEDELVQREFTAPGDSLNYREMLFEKLGGLPPIVSSADARPTVQSYAVFDKLAGQADVQLAALQGLVED